MTFDEILPALKNGQQVKRKCWTIIIRAENGSFWFKNEDDYDCYYGLSAEDVFANDWEIVE